MFLPPSRCDSSTAQGPEAKNTKKTTKKTTRRMSINTFPPNKHRRKHAQVDVSVYNENDNNHTELLNRHKENNSSPRPLNIAKNGNLPSPSPPYDYPITTMGKLRDYWEVPCFGSLRGLGWLAAGKLVQKAHSCGNELRATP